MGTSKDRHESPSDLVTYCAVQALDALSVGVLLLGGERQVYFANDRARELLRRGTGLQIIDGKLTYRRGGSRNVERELELFCSGTGRGPVVQSVPNTGSSRPFTMAMVGLPCSSVGGGPGRPIAVFIADPDRSMRMAAHAVARLYRLTRAERRLVERLLEGQTLKAASIALGVSYSTVRSQMVAVLRKTGVRRQGELMALCIASSINLRTDFRG